MEKLKKIFGGDTRQFGMIFALVALIILFQFTTDGVMLKPDNVINIFQGNAYILVLAVGMVLVIIAGHIDLSVGSVAAFAGIVVAIAIRDWGIHWTLGVLLGLVVGALIGAWQGFWVAYVGIPAFIVTLAGMLLFRGANQFVGDSNTIPVPEGFQKIGAGFLREMGPNTGYNNLTILLGVAIVAAIVLGALRTRANQAKIGAELEPLAILVIRLVLISAASWASRWFRSSVGSPSSGSYKRSIAASSSPCAPDRPAPVRKPGRSPRRRATLRRHPFGAKLRSRSPCRARSVSHRSSRRSA